MTKLPFFLVKFKVEIMVYCFKIYFIGTEFKLESPYGDELPDKVMSCIFLYINIDQGSLFNCGKFQRRP